MRTQTFISSMVGIAAAVAVAGSANAALTFDSFSNPLTTGTPDGTVTNGSFMGGFFTTRTLTADGATGSGSSAKSLTTSIGGGNLTVNTNGPSSTARYGEAFYDRGSNGDLSNFASISVTIAFSNYTGITYFNFSDLELATYSGTSDARTAYTGTQTLTFNKADFVGNVNWAQVENFSMTFSSKATSAGSAVLTNFNYSVPAPGALALLGAAGLVGARRRRA